jgi:hypothetical protein
VLKEALEEFENEVNVLYGDMEWVFNFLCYWGIFAVFFQLHAF